MHKSRSKFSDIDESIFKAIQNNPLSFFDQVDGLSFKIPSFAKHIIILLQQEKRCIDMVFFEENQEFLISYTKKTLRDTENTQIICFINDGGWKVYDPPTLIGVDIKTKLRKKT